MDDPTAVSNLTEWSKLAAGGGLGGLVLALFARFAFRKMAEEDTASQRAGGETDIIQQLRSEVDRMAVTNERLSGKVSELQDQLMAMRSENAELKSQVQELHLQIKSMFDQQQRCATCPNRAQTP